MTSGAHDHRRVALFHGTILCVSVMAAVLAYTRPQWAPRDTTSVVVPPSPLGPLAITYAEGDTAVGVERSIQGDVTVDVTVTGPAPTRARYHGNLAAQHLLNSLLPLEARRPLGMLDAAHRANFGLEPAQATLVVATQSQRTVVALGHTLYGSGDVYAHVEGRGGYVLPAGLSRPFQQAGFALWDRRFLRANLEEIERFEASVDGRICTFVRASHGDEAPSFARTTSPSLRDAPAASLLQAWVQLQFVHATDAPAHASGSRLAITWWAKAQNTAKIIAAGEQVAGLSDTQHGPLALSATEVEALWSLAREACPEGAQTP